MAGLLAAAVGVGLALSAGMGSPPGGPKSADATPPLTPRRSDFEAWVESIASLPPNRQVRAVADKLVDLNPDFDGRVTPKIEGGVVTELEFSTAAVADISPVRALPGLRLLKCGSSAGVRGRLRDLSPLAGTGVERLYCPFTEVADLSPLRGSKLLALYCFDTNVTDLGPLGGSRLEELHVGSTKVTDLSPLRGLPLKQFYCGLSTVGDLSPLAGGRLEAVDCTGTPVASLVPLQGQPIWLLKCEKTVVSDLAPAAAARRLRIVWCREAKVIDLSPLAGSPVQDLTCDFVPGRDEAALRGLRYLNAVNGKRAADFWKEVEAKKGKK